MPTIDPKWRFLISIIVTVAIGVSQGAVHLTNAIPEMWIPIAVAWCGIIAFVGSAAQTGLSAVGMTTSNRLASAAAIPEVKTIVTSDAAMADAAGPKVIKS